MQADMPKEFLAMSLQGLHLFVSLMLHLWPMGWIQFMVLGIGHKQGISWIASTLPTSLKTFAALA